MEFTNEIEWYGDSKNRFLERAIEREAWGHYNGNPDLGRRLLQEVQNKIKEVANNLNMYQERENNERVAVLAESNYVLVYKKEYIKTSDGNKVKLLVLDVRKSY
jgi:hypothetical protein